MSHPVCYHSQCSLVLLDTLWKTNIGEAPEALSLLLYIFKQMTAAFSLEQCAPHFLYLWFGAFLCPLCHQKPSLLKAISLFLFTSSHTVHPSLWSCNGLNRCFCGIAVSSYCVAV